MTTRPQRHLPLLMSDLMAAMAATVTASFQAYYLVAGVERFVPVFTANLVFLGAYGTVLHLNRSGRGGAGRVLVVVTVAVQLFSVTAMISTGPGVHLYYVTVGISLCLLFPSARPAVPAAFVVAAAALFLACHLMFTPGSTPLDVPAAAQEWMYAINAFATVMFGAIYSLAFGHEIARTHRALAASNAELTRLARVDGLTGVANRRAFDDALDREWRRLERSGGAMAVLLCDIDHFKAFNDGHGHVAGDARLGEVAAALEASARVTDLVARFGGEEFAMILVDGDLSAALTCAERARRHVEDTGTTVSIGVAHGGPGSVTSPAELVSRADEALYEAKAAGRNRVVAWSPSEALAQVDGRG